MNPHKQTEDRIRQVKHNVESPASMDSRILMDAYAAIPVPQSQSAQTGHYLRRILMKNTVKFTAAAIIIVGISAIMLFNSGPGSVALADVYAKVQQAKAITYRTKMYIPEESVPRETIVFFSDDYGTKEESYINGKISVIQYTLPKQKKMVSILPNEKQYIEVKADKEQYSTLGRLKNDPREFIPKMMSCEYKSLGKTVIEGTDVEVFESSDPKIGGSETILKRIWVDITTLYPVQIETENSILDENGTEGKRITVRTLNYDFQWDVNTSESTFEPIIPSDYTLRDIIKLPMFDQKAAIEGLQKFSEMTKRYPVSMGINEFMEDVNREIKKNCDPNILESLSSQEKRELVSPFQSLFLFYEILLHDEKDLAYYGDVVTPDDADAVLMRWKNDTGTYTVIFGDLSSGEMEYEDMIKLEPKTQP